MRVGFYGKVGDVDEDVDVDVDVDIDINSFRPSSTFSIALNLLVPGCLPCLYVFSEALRLDVNKEKEKKG